MATLPLFDYYSSIEEAPPFFGILSIKHFLDTHLSITLNDLTLHTISTTWGFIFQIWILSPWCFLKQLLRVDYSQFRILNGYKWDMIVGKSSTALSHKEPLNISLNWTTTEWLIGNSLSVVVGKSHVLSKATCKTAK